MADQFPCDNPCPVCTPGPGGGVGPVDPANPFINISSEEPDVDVFFARRYSPGGGWDFPPPGTIWYAVGCIGFCASRISQEDANLCAQRQAVLCASTDWPVPDPNNPNPDDPPVPRPVFYNHAQFAQFQCPDGTPYYFTVAAGVFSSFNQDTADQMAYSYALNQGSAIRVCLGPLTPTVICAGSVYDGSIVGSFGQGRASFTINGDLPDGLLSSQNNTTLFISGTPTTPGIYSFSVTATDVNGVSQTKSYTLSVFGISTPSPLPDATVGQPYSEILTAEGSMGTVFFWELAEGSSLPQGLTLNSSTGEISGTPDFDGLQGFTINVSDGATTCSKAFTMTVNAASNLSAYWTFDHAGDPVVVGADFYYTDEVAGIHYNSSTLTPNGPNVQAGLILNGNQTQEFGGPGANALDTGQQAAFGITDAGCSLWGWVTGDFNGLDPFWIANVWSEADAPDMISLQWSPNTNQVSLIITDGINPSQEIDLPLTDIELMAGFCFIGGTYNPVTGDMALYVNGASTTGVSAILLPPQATGRVFIGSSSDNNGSLIMDEVGYSFLGVYDATRMAQIYNAGAGVTWPAVNLI